MKKTIGILVVLVVVVVLGFMIFGRKNNSSSTSSNGNQSQNSNQSSGNDSSQPATEAGNIITGTLKASNSSAKGNLMLVTDNQTLYLRTSRDFSALIGQKVSVSYDGTLDNFTLLTIAPAQ